MKTKRKFKIRIKETVDGNIHLDAKYPEFSTIEVIGILEVLKEKILKKSQT